MLPAGDPDNNLTPINGDVVCSRCGSAELVENDRDLDRGGCGCPRVWLDQRRDVLPHPCAWLGLVRLADNRWRCVAAAESLSAIWDCLQSFPLDGDRLAWPVRRAA
jgi:hypothetical protein